MNNKIEIWTSITKTTTGQRIRYLSYFQGICKTIFEAFVQLAFHNGENIPC
jgi:hypothetical protein